MLSSMANQTGNALQLGAHVMSTCLQARRWGEEREGFEGVKHVQRRVPGTCPVQFLSNDGTQGGGGWQGGLVRGKQGISRSRATCF